MNGKLSFKLVLKMIKSIGKCLSISHITLYVSNARQTAINYCLQYGFRPLRYRGLECGHRSQASHAIINNDIVLVFVSPLTSAADNDQINAHIVKHGDAVKDIAFNVESIDALVRHIRQTTSQEVFEWRESDQKGSVKFANVSAYGDTTHTLVERNGYPRELFLPGWMSSPLKPALKDTVWSKLSPVSLQFIDHVAVNQASGQTSQVVKWYENVMGFRRFWSADDTIISTELSGLKTNYVTNDNERVKVVITESGPGSKRSQIQEFLDYNCGPGVQHIALNTNDICDTVAKLRDRGVEFLSIPDTYYQQLRQRLTESDVCLQHDVSRLKDLNILIDFDRNGYLLQIFSKPVQDRPTLFIELIERHNYSGFGAGNIRALFQAIEAEQSCRGNL